MYVKEVTVENQVGLHARPATFFIQKANEFKSSIWVEKEERRVNAKSLLGVLSLGIVGGTTIRIIADGADEQAAVDGLIKLVDFFETNKKALMLTGARQIGKTYSIRRFGHEHFSRELLTHTLQGGCV